MLVYRDFGMGLAAISLWVVLGCTPSQKPSENVYRGALTSNLKSFDPVFASDEYSNISQFQVYEALYEYKYLARPYDVQPLLAAALPVVSDSGLVYTVTLRTDIRFQDDPCFAQGRGRKFTAKDMLYSILRFADVRSQTFGWWVLDGKIEGLDAWRKASESLPALPDSILPPLYSEPISGLMALNDSTLQFKLTKPFPYFKYLLAMPYLAAVPYEAVQYYGEDFGSHPVGTGPYRLAEWRRGLRLRFEKNSNYHHGFYPTEGEEADSINGLLKDAGMPLPFIDKVDLTIYEETQPMWLNFLRQRLDRSTVPKDNYNEAVTTGHQLRDDFINRGIRSHRMSELDVIYVGFNLNDPAVGQHKAWRQAMALALNIEEVIELFYNGRAIRAQSPIPPGLFGYDASFKSPYGKFDLDAAKKRLAEAGFAGGKGIPELEYLTVSGSDTRQRGEHFAQCMAAIGIRIKVVTCTWPEFLDRLKKQQFQIVGAAWAADYPDPENFLQLLYGPNSSPGENCTSFRNQAFDSLFTQMAVLSDSPERLEIIRKMQTIVAEETPWIPQVHRVQLSLTWPWLQNFKPNDPLRTPFKYYRIDAKQRAEAAQ